jgi:ATP-dependent Clp protease ATP-binding subunit ClpC
VFERFTDRARRVLILAQEEARRLNHSFMGTEHILLGLISESEGIPAAVFSELGLSLEAARHEVEERVGRSSTEPTGSPPFTPRAKKVMERALKEALALQHQYIGPEHLLLGLLALNEGNGMEVLADLRIDPAQLREAVLQKMVPGDDPPGFTTDDRIHSLRHLATGGSGSGGPRPYPLNRWRLLWYTRIVRLPFIFYPVAWFDCSVPGTKGHLTWLMQPREVRLSQGEGRPGA